LQKKKTLSAAAALRKRDSLIASLLDLNGIHYYYHYYKAIVLGDVGRGR
jgi:hypothetical protein